MCDQGIATSANNLVTVSQREDNQYMINNGVEMEMKENWNYLRERTRERRRRRWCRYRRRCSIAVPTGSRRKGGPAARILRVHDSVAFAVVVALAVAGTVGDGGTAVVGVCPMEAGHSSSGTGRSGSGSGRGGADKRLAGPG